MTSERMLVGVVLAGIVAGVAWLTGSLTLGGAVAAAIVGGVTYGAGGILPAVLLIVFFVTSSALSRFGTSRKRLVGDQFEKGIRRDQYQVLANGGIAALLSLAYGLSAELVALAGLAGALAAATADTWATELGVLSRRRPRRITDGRRVAPGTSGAVSLEGSLAAAAGAALIAGLAAWGIGEPAMGFAVLLGGAIGTSVDSLLGGTVQAVFECPACQKETERHPLHTCGTATRPVRGWRWLRNDAVNAIASASGALVAGSMWIVFSS